MRAGAAAHAVLQERPLLLVPSIKGFQMLARSGARIWLRKAPAVKGAHHPRGVMRKD